MILTDRQDELTGFPSIDKPWKRLYSGLTVDENILNRTVWQNVYECNKNSKKDIALIYQGKKIDYNTIFIKTEELALALVSNGICAGDSIIVCSTGTPETVYLLLACSKIGICAEMINLTQGQDAITESIHSSKASYIFCLDKIYEKIQGMLIKTEKKVVVIPATYSLSLPIRLLVEVFSPKKIKNNKVLLWKDFLKSTRSDYEDNSEPFSELVVVYTSGSTGTPKGIVHTNHSYTAISEQYRICDYPFKRGDILLNQLPFFIAAALSYLLFAPLMQGMTIVLEPVYECDRWIADILKYKPHVACATRSFWETACFNNAFDKKDLSFIMLPIQGGEPNTIQFEKEINAALKKYHCNKKLVVGYGMSELNGTVTTTSYKHHTPGATGIPLPDVVVAAFDVKNRRECKYMERGELMVMTPCAMKEYLNNPELTERFRWSDQNDNIWYRTGDIGYVDKYGEVYVLGRAVDCVETSNHLVYFFDIEKIILEIAGVADCKVVADNCNALIANIILRENTDEGAEIALVKKVCSEKLPSYSIPKQVKVWKEFPINANGKCDKNALK